MVSSSASAGNTSRNKSATLVKGISDAHLVSRYSNSGLVVPRSQTRRRPECSGAALLTRAAIPAGIGNLHHSKQSFHCDLAAALGGIAVTAARATAPLLQI